MKYRAKFLLGGRIYYTEWLDTLAEAKTFAREAYLDGLAVRQIEDEDGQVV